MNQTQLTSVLVGIGCGIILALLVLLCIYCLRRRLVQRGVIRDVDNVTLSREQQRMYLANRQKVRMKRYSYQKKIKKELAAIPKTPNPLVYNEREVELTTPGPATKSTTPVNTST